LLVGNALLFLIFGPGDGIARLLPALAGVGLVLLPFFWRKHLGDIGAVAASGLLLISPLTLFIARRAEGATVGALGAALLLTALTQRGINTSERERPIGTTLLGGLGTILGLTGGAVFYDALLGGLAAWGVYRWLHTTSQSETQPEAPTPEAQRPPLKHALAIGIGGALLLSAGLGLRWSGWLNLGEGLAAWLAQWRGGIDRTDLRLLVCYEPLLLALAVAHVWRAIRRAVPLPLALTAGTLIALLLISLRPGARVSALVVTLPPLACLAGRTIQRLVETSRDQLPLSSETATHPILPPGFRNTGVWLHMGAVFVLWMHAGLAVARYSLAGTDQGLEIILITLTILIQGLLVMGMIPLFNPRTAWQGFLRGSILTLGVVQISFAWGLAFVRPADPAELAVRVATSPDLWNLRGVMDDLAVREGWHKDNAELAVVKGDEALTAVLRWTLRDYRKLQVRESWPEALDAGFVITPARDDLSSPGGEANWRGMSAVAITRAAEARVTCAAEKKLPLCPSALKWYVYRKGNIPPQTEHVRLWMQP
jgi:hypothetical protein